MGAVKRYYENIIDNMAYNIVDHITDKEGYSNGQYEWNDMQYNAEQYLWNHSYYVDFYEKNVENKGVDIESVYINGLADILINDDFMEVC